MSEYGFEPADDAHGDPFESERRGYSRRQVDEFIARRNLEVRDLENRLTQALGQTEHLRGELTEARQSAARAPHEEISERVGQILKLAADEAKANRERAEAETAQIRETAKKDTEQLRAEAKAETEKLRAEAQNHAEQLIAAAKEQSEHTLSASVAQAEQLTAAAKAEAERTVGEANMHAEKTVAAAIAQAKNQLDEATARAAAVHDGAERRLNLLISRHTETVRRLTEIRDVVTTLVAGEATRGSLEDEVNRTLAANGAGSANGDGRPSGRADAASPSGRGEVGGPAGQRPYGHDETWAAAPAAPAGEAQRPVIPEAAEPLEELPAPPSASRQARSMGVHAAAQPNPRGDRPDPLGTGRGGPAGEGRPHARDTRRQTADDARHPGNPVRHQLGGTARPSLPQDREFDDTPVNGLTVDG